MSSFRISSLVVLVVLAVLLAGFTGSSLLAARDDTPPDIAAMENPELLEESEVRYWQRQFKSKCARCHGKDGTGKGTDATSQVIKPRDFTDAEYMKTRTDGQLYYQIKMGGGLESPMPAFGPESDQAWPETKLWHMVAFIRRFAAEDEALTESAQTKPAK